MIKVNEESVISVSVWVATTLLINNQLTLIGEETHSSSATSKASLCQTMQHCYFTLSRQTRTHIHTSATLLWNRLMFALNSLQDWTPARTTHTLCNAITSTVLIYLPLPAVRHLQGLCKTFSWAWQANTAPPPRKKNKKAKCWLDPSAEFITSLQLNDK